MLILKGLFPTGGNEKALVSAREVAGGDRDSEGAGEVESFASPRKGAGATRANAAAGPQLFQILGESPASCSCTVTA